MKNLAFRFYRLRDVAMATNFLKAKSAKSDYSPLFVALAFRNGLQCSHSDIKKFICDYLVTLCVNLVILRPVTPEFTKLKGVDVGGEWSKVKVTALLINCYMRMRL